MTRYTVSFQVSTICIYIYTYMHIPSRELTYLTLAKGKSSSNIPWEKDMLVPRRVYNILLCFLFFILDQQQNINRTETHGAFVTGSGLVDSTKLLGFRGSWDIPIGPNWKTTFEEVEAYIYIYYIYAYYVFYILYIWFIMFHKSMVSIF